MDLNLDLLLLRKNEKITKYDMHQKKSLLHYIFSEENQSQSAEFQGWIHLCQFPLTSSAAECAEVGVCPDLVGEFALDDRRGARPRRSGNCCHALRTVSWIHAISAYASHRAIKRNPSPDSW